MVNFSSMSLNDTEIINFLKRDLRLEEIYREIIHQKIIAQVAQEHGLVVTPAEIQKEIDRLCLDMNFDSPNYLLLWLAQQKTTLEDLKQRLHEKLIAARLSKELFEQQIQQSFSQHPENFEQIVLYKIVVPYQSLAQEIFYQIEEEEISFYEAAHLYDIDERRRLQCGYEGKRQRQMLDPEIAERLFNAEVGEVIGPINTAENIYELFLIDDFLPPSLTPEVYENTLNQLFQEWLNNELVLYLQRFSIA